MANIKDEIYFRSSGLNTDDDKKFMPKGDTDIRVNLIPSHDGAHGVLTSIRGNRLITDISGSGTFEVIGDCYDTRRNCQYIFQYAATGSHNILKYSYDTGALTFLVQANTKIGLDNDYKIFDACVIGDWLFWNPRSSSPRAINVEWAENYYLYDQVVDGTTYDVDDEVVIYGRVFTVISSQTGADLITDVKSGIYLYSRDTGVRSYDSMDMYFYNYTAQPRNAPSFSFGSDTDRKVNHLKKNVFQFAYRYIMDDGAISITSPYSGVAVAQTSETYTGESYDTAIFNVSVDNKITLTIPYPDTDHASVNNLSGIEVLFRQAGSTGWGVWKTASTIPWENLIRESETINYTFYNDKNYAVSDQDEVSRAYSALPVLAQAQSSIMKDRIVYGGLTEGMNNITPIVTLTPSLQELSLYTSGTLEDTWSLTEAEVLGGWGYTFYSSGAPIAGRSVVVTINGDTVSYLVTAADAIDEDGFLGRLADFIRLNFFGVKNVSADTVSDSVYFEYTIPRYFTDISTYSGSTASFLRFKGFKSGAVHKFGRFYYDALMRRSGVMVNDDASFGTMVDVPFITENSITSGGYVYRYNIAWDVNDAPPDDAVYWRWAYAGNTTMTWFVQTDIDSWSVGTDYTSIVITHLQSKLATTYPHLNLAAYVFTEGDRVRLITPVPDALYNTYDDSPPFNVLYDEEIVSFDTDTDTIKIRNMVSPPDDMGTGSFIEIYRPQQSEAIEYYEYGSLYDIYEDGGVRYHRGNTQDQTASQGAQGVFTEGDIYHITRITDGGGVDGVLYPVESMSASDFYDSGVWGTGKVGFVDKLGRVYVNNLRYSDPYIQDTQINGLSSFQYLNYDTITNKYGRITGLVEIGHTLRVYCERNGISVPVGRTQYTDASGSETVVVSDTIFGAHRVGLDEYGTVLPESICKVGSNVYFFDSRKGCFIRDSLNGSYPISGKFATEGGSVDYKMETWFKNMAAVIRTKGEDVVKVLTGWDAEKKLLTVAFHDTDNGYYNSIICFHEPTNRWALFLIGSTADSTDDDDVQYVVYTDGVTTVRKGVRDRKFIVEIWTGSSYEVMKEVEFPGSGSYQGSPGFSVWVVPSWFSKGGNSLFSYKDGDTYIHDATADYCKFYDVQYGIENRVYSSEGNNHNKLYEALAIDCNQLLALDAIYVYSNEVVNGYMRSRIPSSWWKKIEGIYHAPYLRNMLSSSTTINNKDLFNGDFLRGKVIEHRLTKDSVTSELNLFKVELSVDKSNI